MGGSRRREPLLHPIQVVARRTGLTPDAIRAWERRYRAVSPDRSGTNRRLFTEDEIERLVLLRRATLAGRPIGDVAHLSTDDLDALVRRDTAAESAATTLWVPPIPSPEEQVLSACSRALESLDAPLLRATLHRAAVEMGTPALLDRVVVPFLQRIGQGWERGTTPIHHEHLATPIVRSLLEALCDSNARVFGGLDVIVATPQGQAHELGALMVAALAAAEGWNVTYLGASLPAEDIAAAAVRRRSRAVAISIIHPPSEAEVAREVTTLRRLLPAQTEILAGGSAAPSYDAVLREIGAHRLESLRDLRAELDRLRRDA